MNVKRYFIVLGCILAVCAAIICGVILAGRLIVPGEQLTADNLEEPVGGRANILVLGVDKDQVRTDTIIFASLDMENNHLTLLSIPRDTRIYDGNAYDKINHMYGKPEREAATIEAVKNLLDVPVNYCVIINFDALHNIVDALGGVEIDVPNVPNAWSNGRRGMYYSDPAQNLEISLKEGLQTLDGDQCEQFLRFRYGYPNGDLGRIEKQQYFMKEIVRQKLNPKYITKAPEIFSGISKSIRTNYTLGDMTSHLLAIQKMDSDDVETIQVPGVGQDAETRYGVLSCYVVDEPALKQLIDDYFGDDPIYTKPESTSETEEKRSGIEG